MADKEPLQSQSRSVRGCFVLAALVLALLLVAVEFLPPISVAGCSIGANHIHGRVIDQHGKPVAHTKITHSAKLSLTGEGNTSHETESDAEGNFSTFHPLGWVYIGVSKKGYYTMPTEGTTRGSEGSFSPADAYRSSAANPFLFRLWKQGDLEPLIKRNADVQVSEAPRILDLAPNKTNATYQLVVRIWIKPAAQSEKRFDWRAEISVPYGGLQNRSEHFSFTAPESGYRESDTLEFAANSPDWTSLADRTYFLKFKDGIYARVNMGIHATERPFVSFESLLNPKVGSRNLESGTSR